MAGSEHFISIDGKQYDLRKFKHPGGDIIKMYGGTDVTAAYRSRHPLHPKEYFRKAMKDAEVEDPVILTGCESSQYIYDSEFSKELITSVNIEINHFSMSWYADKWFYFRSFVYISLYIYSNWLYVTSPSLFSAVLGGISCALIGLNVQHSGNHGSVSRVPVINDLFGWFNNLIGSDRFDWIQQHDINHHPHTNIHRCDGDTKNDPLISVSKWTTMKWFTKYQVYYLPFLATLFFIPKFFNISLFTGKASSLNVYTSYHASMRSYIILFKIFFLAMWLSPLRYGIWYLPYIYGAVGSSILVWLFIVSHNYVGVQHFGNSATEKDWYKLQVETSSTYGGKFAGYLTGGLNFQIEHHLFPRMNPCWYPVISPIVRRVCKKHDVKYVYFSSFFENLKSTLRYLATVSTKTDVVHD